MPCHRSSINHNVRNQLDQNRLNLTYVKTQNNFHASCIVIPILSPESVWQSPANLTESLVTALVL